MPSLIRAFVESLLTLTVLYGPVKDPVQTNVTLNVTWVGKGLRPIDTDGATHPAQPTDTDVNIAHPGSASLAIQQLLLLLNLLPCRSYYRPPFQRALQYPMVHRHTLCAAAAASRIQHRRHAIMDQ